MSTFKNMVVNFPYSGVALSGLCIVTAGYGPQDMYAVIGNSPGCKLVASK